MAPKTECCVCNESSTGMIQIKNHPNKLDQLLNFISGHESTELDFLCIVCYEELKQACDFKRKCIESKHYRAENPQKVDVKTESIDQANDCDSSIISLTEILGSGGYVLPNIETEDRSAPEVEEIIIDDSSEDEQTPQTTPLSSLKNGGGGGGGLKAASTDENLESNIDLFFSTSDKICEFCFQVFDAKRTADVHKKIHKFEPNPYICPYKNCRKKFQKRHVLQTHYIVHITKYKCSFCEKTYKSKVLMENHEKTHHNNSSGFTSESSTGSSSRKSSKKYECKVCKREFGAKANLVFHVKYQHDKNWSAKEFECILCDDVFQQSDKLAAHLKKVHKCS